MEKLEKIKKVYSFYFKQHAKTEDTRRYLKDVKWLISEIELLRSHFDEADKARKAALGEQGMEYEKEIERLRKALKTFGRHTTDCRLFVPFREPGKRNGECTCGFEQTLKEE